MPKIFSRFHYPNWFPVLIGILFRLININAPILGVHSWRQADTAAMARHFALEGTPIWLPQIDWAGANSGYVECEFPIFPYLVGQLYKLLGLHEWIGRGLSIFFSAITILLLIRIGALLLDPASGWWGGLFFSLLPLNIYYGRTFQAESLLLFLAALSIERLLAWKINSHFLSLWISWSAFCLACLIKLLPFIWLGLPLLLIQSNFIDQSSARSFKKLSSRLITTLKSPGVILYAISAIFIVIIWFWYAYNLGKETGFSFFIWGKDTDRVSIQMLFNFDVWSNLFLRVIVRNLSILGLPIVLLGLWQSKKDLGLQVFYSGLVGVFICTIFAIRSSSVHEYYQLPLQLFLCPIMGRGWTKLTAYLDIRRISKYLKICIISLITIISITVLSIDYFLVEINQSNIWMPLVETIREEVDPRSRIVTVTGLDPTLLNLARRQGWLTSAENVNQDNIRSWVNQGAKYITGSLNWQESYIPLNNSDAQYLLSQFPCKKEDLSFCPEPPNYTYLIKLNELIGLD